MGHNSFLKLFHEWTTDFLNKNNENMDYQKQKSQENLMFMYANSGQNKHSTDEKEKKLTQIIFEKRIFCQNNSHAPVANKITASHKKWCAHSETVFNGNSKREFCCFLVYEKNLLFGIMVFWVGGKNLHHEK